MSSNTNGNVIVSPSPTTTGNAIVSPTDSNTAQPTTTTTTTTTTTDTTASTISSSPNILYTIFSRSNIILIFWFLAIYYVVYFLLSIFYSSEQNKLKTASNIFDLLIFVVVLFVLGYNFLDLSSQEKQIILSDTVKSLENYVSEPMNIISTILFIVVFYLVIFLVGIPMSYDTKPRSIQIVESLAWIMLTFELIDIFFRSIFGVSFIQLLTNLFTGVWDKLPSTTQTTTTTTTTDASGNAIKKEEVFNIGNNMYTYDDAHAVCKSYGARLATYDEVEKAYNGGAEWCNYGWSADQMAFFPTQKSTWLTLQKDPSTQNACGRPGVNGGYFENPNIRFGVNCYGAKPAATANDLAYMSASAAAAGGIPTNQQQSLIDKKAQFYKENAEQLMRVNAFNGNKWSEY